MLAFVNGMGGTPLIELYVVYRELAQVPRRARGITIARNLVGNYITSLEMAGCSITLLKLDDELTRLWDAPGRHAGVAVGSVTWPPTQRSRLARARFAEHRRANGSSSTELDSAIGDADHGTNMDRGMKQVLEKLDGPAGADIGDPAEDGRDDTGRRVGGAAGPLYGTLFLQMGTAAAGKERARPRPAGPRAARPASRASQSRGKAEPGDKTMIDALLPALEALRARWRRRRRRGAARRPTRPRTGMKATIPMEARKGRASYLGPRSVGHQDPGATSSYLLMRTAADALAG